MWTMLVFNTKKSVKTNQFVKIPSFSLEFLIPFVFLLPPSVDPEEGSSRSYISAIEFEIITEMSLQRQSV